MNKHQLGCGELRAFASPLFRCQAGKFGRLFSLPRLLGRLAFSCVVKCVFVCVCDMSVCVCKVHPGGYISPTSVSSERKPVLPLAVRSFLALHWTDRQTDRHTHPNRKQTGNAQLRMQHEIFVPCAGRESAVRIFAFPTFPDPQSLFHSIRLPLMSYVLSTVASNPITL